LFKTFHQEISRNLSTLEEGKSIRPYSSERNWAISVAQGIFNIVSFVKLDVGMLGTEFISDSQLII